MSDRAAIIDQLLRDAFSPSELLVKDQSHLHVGHAGAREGKGHFDVKVISDKFIGHSRISRHRMVYDAIGEFMLTNVHALRITALSPQD